MQRCSKHKVDCVWKEGISKAGKRYAFWACPVMDGNDYCQAEKYEVEDGESQLTSTKTSEVPAPRAEEKEDWEAKKEAENRGKVKHGLVVATIEHDGLHMFSESELATIEELADFIMG